MKIPKEYDMSSIKEPINYLFNINKAITYIFLFASFFLCDSKKCFAEVVDIKNIQHAIDEIEKESQELVGGGIAIISNNKTIYKKSFGIKDSGNYQPRNKAVENNVTDKVEDNNGEIKSRIRSKIIPEIIIPKIIATIIYSII